MAKQESKAEALDAQMDKIREAHDEVDRVESDYLRRRGWKYTSSNLCSIWLWEKQLPDGRLAIVNRDTALDFQERIDENEIENDGATGAGALP